MKTRSRAKLGDTIELLDENEQAIEDEDQIQVITAEQEQYVQNDDAKQCTVVGRVKTRSRTRLGDTVVLLDDSDPDSNDVDTRSTCREDEVEEPLQIGEVGYTFQKQFNQGWFTGKVIEIRYGAAKGKDRRCQYEDGDVEDLSLTDLTALASKASTLIKSPEPEHVPSNTDTLFDRDNYEELKQRYLTPQIRKNVELPSGITIRRQYRDRYIDKSTPDFKLLKQKIEALKNLSNDEEIYKLLVQLRNWEINTKNREIWRSLGIIDEGVNEYVDLTNEVKRCVVDVETEPEAFRPDHCKSVASQELKSSEECVDLTTDEAKRCIDIETKPEVIPDHCKSVASQELKASEKSDVGHPEDIVNMQTSQTCNAPSSTVFNALLEGVQQNNAVTGCCNIVSPEKSSSTDGHASSAQVPRCAAASCNNVDIKPPAALSSSPPERSHSKTPNLFDNDNINSKTNHHAVPFKPNTDASKFQSDQRVHCGNHLQAHQHFKMVLPAKSPPITKITDDAVEGIEQYISKEVKRVLSTHRNDIILADCLRKLDYEALEKRYLTPEIINQPQLSSGMTIRRKRGERFIDRPGARYRKLRHRIDSLMKQRKQDEVHNILRQLKTWEDNPSWDKVWTDLGVDDEEDGEEFVDLTSDNEDRDLAACEDAERKETYVKNDDSGDRISKISDTDLAYTCDEKATKQVIAEPKCEASINHCKAQVTCDHFTLDAVKREHNAVSVDAANSVNETLQVQPAASILFSIKTKQSDGSIIKTWKKVGRKKLPGAKLEFLAATARSFGKKQKAPFSYAINEEKQEADLAQGWKMQGKKRRKGEWTPSGHLTGKWKAPQWADGAPMPECKPATCKKVLLPILERLVNDFIERSVPQHATADNNAIPTPAQLMNVICPRYLIPNRNLLQSAHRAVHTLLPEGDCESFDVVTVARNYCDYWRPKRTKVILLAESHAATEHCLVRERRLEESILSSVQYSGPREFLSLVYCLSYGENKSLCQPIANNKGTPQFWTLLAACSRGTDYVPAAANLSKQTASTFAADILKGGGLSVEDRLNAKLKVLEDLRERGIWLIDTSIFGWYITQKQKYKRSTVSSEVHRMQKERPPGELKFPSLVLSFELFTKHLVREIAHEGHLQLVIPIGRDVEKAITKEKLEDAVRVPGVKDHARVVNAFPAPNAWIPGGYGVFHTKLADLVHSVAPRKMTQRTNEETKRDQAQCPSIPTLPPFESTNMMFSPTTMQALPPFATNPSDCPALPDLPPW